jgi:iron transport multicopper oxidase
MQVIEMDGIDTVPTETDMLTIAVAQRYSVYVEAKSNADSNYAMMVWQDPDMYDAIPEELVLNNTVQIQYSADLPKAEEFTFDVAPTEYSTYPIADDTIFKPLLRNASAPPDQEFTIVATFDVGSLSRKRCAVWLELIDIFLGLCRPLTMVPLDRLVSQTSVLSPLSHC